MTKLKAGPELNALVAEEVMGWVRLSMYVRDAKWAWHLCDPAVAGHMMKGREEYHLALDGESPASDDWQHYAPNYSKDIVLARQVEERIDELGLRQAYLRSLLTVLFGDAAFGADTNITNGYYIPDDFLWNMVHATPEERCIAAVMAKRMDGST